MIASPIISDSPTQQKFWQRAIANLERELRSGRDGLSSAEAGTRYGPGISGGKAAEHLKRSVALKE
jgi:hypothetical protein